MGRKEAYKESNREFLRREAAREGVVKHPSGILYEVLRRGGGTVSPRLSSIVTVHYTGRLASGRVFDDSRSRGCAEAMRVSDLIAGWQIVLPLMRAGDCWRVYVPFELGYGSRPSGPIPAFSTLVFEIELVGIA